MTRDERQEICIQKWKSTNGKATIEAGTGFGKTVVGLKIISRLVERKPNLDVIIVVPTITLKEQWESKLGGLLNNCTVLVINTVIKEVNNCDLLIIDEIHRVFADTFKEVFKCVGYKYILGLTATVERLDGKHLLIQK